MDNEAKQILRVIARALAVIADIKVSQLIKPDVDVYLALTVGSRLSLISAVACLDRMEHDLAPTPTPAQSEEDGS